MVKSISIKEVIVVEENRGSGESFSDPVRKITEYFSKGDGQKLLVCSDPEAPKYNEQIGGWDLQETDLVQVDGVIVGTMKDSMQAMREATMFIKFVKEDEKLSEEFDRFKEDYLNS